MESSQVVCSSPLFCKVEPESPPAWDAVDFTESNFGEYWPDDWEDAKDFVDAKNYNPADILLDLDSLMKEEPFTWIDDRNDGLYTAPFDWSPSDVKVFNIPSPPSITASSVEHKPFANIATGAVSSINGGKLFHHGLVTSSTTSSSSSSSSSSPLPLSAATPDLLREFEDVLINGPSESLTPPDSPRDQTASLITLLQDIEPCTSSSNEIDAIVATQAENMVPQSPQHQSQSQHQLHEQPHHQQLAKTTSPLSPDPWSSPSMGSSSCCSDSGYDDPDWSPSSPTHQASAITSNLTSNNNNNNTSTTVISSSQRRKRSAVTTTEERKLRKKEQNKNAATRYRQKKKHEIENIVGEERELMEKHERLKADATEVTREIRYLKSLLRDLYKAKGLIS